MLLLRSPLLKITVGGAPTDSTTLWTLLQKGHYDLFFGLLLAVTLVLFVTCALVSATSCYYQLLNEDYRWWWQSFLNTGSSALYLLLYIVWYYFAKSTILGAAGFVFYFGYMSVVCTAFLITGSIGFFSSFLFVSLLYSSIKVGADQLNPLLKHLGWLWLCYAPHPVI